MQKDGKRHTSVSRRAFVDPAHNVRLLSHSCYNVADVMSEIQRPSAVHQSTRESFVTSFLLSSDGIHWLVSYNVI